MEESSCLIHEVKTDPTQLSGRRDYRGHFYRLLFRFEQSLFNKPCEPLSTERELTKGDFYFKPPPLQAGPLSGSRQSSTVETAMLARLFGSWD
jgi:hypothetical protein